MRSKLGNSGRRIQSDPFAPVRPRSAWALLCGGIFEPWSYLCAPPSLILSTYMSCCDGACVTAPLRRCLAPHQLSSVKLLTTLKGVFFSAPPPLTHSLFNPILTHTHTIYFGQEFLCVFFTFYFFIELLNISPFINFSFSLQVWFLLWSSVFVTNLSSSSLVTPHTERCF